MKRLLFLFLLLLSVPVVLIGSATYRPYISVDSSNRITSGTLSAGTILWCQPFQGTSYKKFVGYLDGATTTTSGSITFPTAFVKPPLLTTVLTGTFAVSTTALSLTCTTQTGWIMVEGF